ncbi:hypothetical protein [Pollutimonas bauzanensis]|uniref:Uncharacterized protein n=1 Tax=Pollutimonas bauzanensis TaxID=658167 RepID=A0A1M5ZSH9_9BURK|nr:hypothetical protein [Pollutimonas bauzanensis]SHI27220.1 hypothetical protein SAMN04488135_11825 [Pollutimonas bauzanensis]
MDLYIFGKEILVPLVSPLIAVLTLVTYAHRERRKMVVQADIELRKSVHALERDVLALREAYQLVALKMHHGETVEPERIKVIEEISDRIFKRFGEMPVVYDKYFSKPKAKIRSDRIPLLLTEMQIRLRLLPKATKVENIVLFGLYLLLYARAPAGSDAEELKITQNIFNSDPTVYSAWWQPDA